MQSFKMPLLLVLVYGFLAIIIYTGATVLPSYFENPKENNFFLSEGKEENFNPKEKQIASDCKEYMEKLEKEFHNDLEELGTSAYEEYNSLKKQDPSASPYSLAGKYLKKARELEDTYDSRFNKYVSDMERELKANSLSTELIGQAEYAYRQQKREMKEEFMQRAKEMLG